MNDVAGGSQALRTAAGRLMCVIENEQSRKLATVRNHNTISQRRWPHHSSWRHKRQKNRRRRGGRRRGVSIFIVPFADFASQSRSLSLSLSLSLTHALCLSVYLSLSLYVSGVSLLESRFCESVVMIFEVNRYVSSKIHSHVSLEFPKMFFFCV